MIDPFFMGQAQDMAKMSRDTSTKTGCIIELDGEVLAWGWNELPTGVSDTPERRERPEKYFWTEHAERNAIYHAARLGKALNGSTAYLTWFPCMDCARALVMAGVKRIVCVSANMDHPKYADDFKRAKVLFEEADVAVEAMESAS